MPKMMLEFDTEKDLKSASMDPEMSYKGTKGRASGGKEGKPPKAALRYAGFLNLKRLTPAGVGGL